LDLQKKILTIQTAQTRNIQRQADLAKGLRDQYVDAITAFTQVEGAFSKFVIKKDQGFGKALTEFGMKGGFKTGGIGAGMEGPAYKFGAGGGLQMTMPGQLMQFFTQAYKSADYLPAGTIAPFGGMFGALPAGSEIAGTGVGRQGNQQGRINMSTQMLGPTFAALKGQATAGQGGQGGFTQQQQQAADTMKAGNKPIADHLSKIHETLLAILKRMGGAEGDPGPTGAPGEAGLKRGGGAAGLIAPIVSWFKSFVGDGAEGGMGATGGTGGKKTPAAAAAAQANAANKLSDAADKQKEAAEQQAAAGKKEDERKLKEVNKIIKGIADGIAKVMEKEKDRLGEIAPRPQGAAAEAAATGPAAARAAARKRSAWTWGTGQSGVYAAAADAEKKALDYRRRAGFVGLTDEEKRLRGGGGGEVYKAIGARRSSSGSVGTGPAQHMWRYDPANPNRVKPGTIIGGDGTVHEPRHFDRSSEGKYTGAPRAFGDGGIVNRKTLALIGERGPEAIVPLDAAKPGLASGPLGGGGGGGSGGGGVSISVNVSANMDKGSILAGVAEQLGEKLDQINSSPGQHASHYPGTAGITPV
jgi:hypothetical protein